MVGLKMGWPDVGNGGGGGPNVGGADVTIKNL